MEIDIPYVKQSFSKNNVEIDKLTGDIEDLEPWP